ncbi:hypothetical protein AB0H43_13435 [Hamadaea sp. NPDC050747]|uniref:hypothetical protein n=1 Tax=Hamadaea sp. NPDC050747 TaxID=3155789 RepID=UPI0034018D0E
MNVRQKELSQTSLLMYRAAIGLAALHLPRSIDGNTYTVSSRDVAFILDGHVDVWPGWRALPDSDAITIARLLRIRPAAMADGEHVLRDLRDGLSDGISGCSLVEDAGLELYISCSPGTDLRQFVDDALQELAAVSKAGRGRMRIAGPGTYHSTTRTPAGSGGRGKVIDQHYRIPVYANNPLPAAAEAPVVVTSPQMDEVLIPLEDLRTLAQKIDEIRSDGTAYRAQNVERLIRRLRHRDGLMSLSDALRLTAGDLRLINAPTGIGKSVIMEVIGCWAVLNGIVLTIAVPTNADVLKLARAIEQDLAPFGSASQVTPLMSPSGIFELTRKVNLQKPRWDPDGSWTLERLGYGCALAAAAESERAVDTWTPGEEPCVALYADGGNGKPYACPWRTTCGKFRLARAATSASLIITSHANLHRGRLQIPVTDERGITDKMTVEELVFRRSHAVIIDEVDAFQATVLGEAARGLLLNRRGSLESPLHSLETQFVPASGKINRKVERRANSKLHHMKFLAVEYTAAIDDRIIGIGGPQARRGAGRYWTVPRRWDGTLTAQLFGLAAGEPLTMQMISGFRSLFPGSDDPPQPDEPPEFTAIRMVIAQMLTVGAEYSVEDARDALAGALRALIPDDVARAKALNRILQRAFLERLRQHLRRFVYDAPHLASAGVDAAREIAETFGPYSRWRALPNGPLGRLLFAFSQHVDPAGRAPARLNVAAFGGDPHVYTTTLGDITALCHAQTRRAVLGLSATAYFPMAPHHHVHVDPEWWVADDVAGGVTIHPARLTKVIKGQRRVVRVSGSEGRQRDDALRTLAEGLWSSRLESELIRLANEDPGRARILLATTSYDGARRVAEGLVKAGVHPSRICLAVRPRSRPDIGEQGSEETAGESWWELAADRLEEFPSRAEADILIAPLARVQRGVNIIGDEDKSALGSIWLLVRPVPLIDEPAELIAHVNAHALAADPADTLLADLPHLHPADVLEERKLDAGYYLEQIVTSLPFFRTMPKTVRLAITAAIMNGIIQLVGRARRGGTPATIYLADGAFLDPEGGPTFAQLVLELRDHWQQTGVLERMEDLYGTTLAEFFRFAHSEVQLTTVPEEATCS